MPPPVQHSGNAGELFQVGQLGCQRRFRRGWNLHPRRFSQTPNPKHLNSSTLEPLIPSSPNPLTPNSSISSPQTIQLLNPFSTPRTFKPLNPLPPNPNTRRRSDEKQHRRSVSKPRSQGGAPQRTRCTSPPRPRTRAVRRGMRPTTTGRRSSWTSGARIVSASSSTPPTRVPPSTLGKMT